MKKVNRAKHHTMKGEKGFKILTLSKEANRESFIWQVALLYMHLKGRILRRKKRKPCAGVGNAREVLPQGCTHGAVEKALALKEHLHSHSKAGWLLAAQGEKNNYEVNAHKPYCFLRCSHALGNYDSEIQYN